MGGHQFIYGYIRDVSGCVLIAFSSINTDVSRRAEGTCVPCRRQSTEAPRDFGAVRDGPSLWTSDRAW